jgi:signal transduction histidine kinase/ActR/RegA family two-component response regulator
MDSPLESKSRWGGDPKAEWMNLAVEVAEIGTWEFDLDQGTGSVSQRCSEIMGFPKIFGSQQVRFEDWLAMLPCRDRKVFQQACDPEGDGEVKMRLQLSNSGGPVRHILIRGRVFYSVSYLPEGKPICTAMRLIGIVSKLSDRQFYQKALAESDQRLRWALQHAPIPIIVHSDDGQIIELNRAWERITATPSRRFRLWRLGRRFPGTVRPRGQCWSRSTMPETAMPGAHLNCLSETKDGQYRRWLFYSAALGSMNNGREVRMISALDLTERKAAEEERNRALDQAEAANNSKDQFLATLSHELRTPLNAILGWIFLMKQDAVRPELQKEGLEVIERNARAQSNLIADLLDISRIVAGKLRLEPRPLDFVACLESAVNNVRPLANEKAVRVVNRVDPNILPRIAMYGDPVRVEQVLLNVLVNAIKFTPPSGRVEVSVKVSESLLHLTVADTGIGISPEFLTCLFDRFSQADESLRKDRGLGLGLTISRHIVELHGGKISAMSEGSGKGASFTIQLPTASDQLVNLPDQSSLSNYREQHTQRLDDVKIVAVDDNGDAREFLDRVLQLHGAKVASVDSAAQAIEVVQQFRPHIVLCDLMMPEMDGFALLRQIRALDDEMARAVPVVALTAFAGAENRLKTEQAGFQAHLDKPIDPPQLIDAINTLIKTKKTGKH